MFDAEVAAPHLRDVEPVERDGAAVDLVEPHDQVHERRLARAGGPDDGDGLARLRDEGQVLDERVLRVVGERDVVELDPALRLEVLERHEVVLDLLRRVEQLEHPLGGRDPGLHHVDHRRELGQRLGELARVLDERLDATDGQLARRHHQPADERDGDVVQVAEEHHRRLDGARDELRAVAGLEELLVLVVELLLDVLLAAEHLDQRVPGERLLDLRVQGAGVAPLVDELRLGALGDEPHREDRDAGW